MRTILSIEKIREALSKYDGNWSQLYRLIESFVDWDAYEPPELPFAREFLCFEADYYRYMIHMYEHNLIPERVIDIGCQHGFQSFIFANYMKYTGIEMDLYKLALKNTELKNVTFLRETFPHLSISLEGSTVISNMSLGYYFNPDVNDQVIVTELSKCKTLYIGTRPNIIEMLKPHFNHVEQVNVRAQLKDFPRYAMWK